MSNTLSRKYIFPSSQQNNPAMLDGQIVKKLILKLYILQLECLCVCERPFEHIYFETCMKGHWNHSSAARKQTRVPTFLCSFYQGRKAFQCSFELYSIFSTKCWKENCLTVHMVNNFHGFFYANYTGFIFI